MQPNGGYLGRTLRDVPRWKDFLWLLTALESTSCGPSAGEPVQKVHVEFKNRWKTGALRGIFAL